MKAQFILLACTLSISLACSLSSKNIKETQAINDAVREIVLTNPLGPFNGSILVAKSGKILVRQNYGFIDIEKTAPINDQSRFNIGSAAKEISAFAVLALIEQGKIHYQDKLDQYLDSLPLWAGKITVSNLLFYQSGLPTLNFLTSTTDENAIRDLMEIDTLLFEPGTDYLYSNWNNFLQAKIAESIVEINFQSWVKNQFFEPLGIQSAAYIGNPPEVIENITKAYSAIYGDDIANNPRFKHFKLCYAPLYMTSLDLFKWVEFVSQKYRKGGREIPAFFRETTINGQGPLGVIEWDDGQIQFHKHGGFAYSFGTLIYKDYPKDLTLIVMTNNNTSVDLDRLRNKILELMEELPL